jgi:hypothetical protein
MAGEFLSAPREDQIAFLKSRPEFAGTSDTDLHDFINQYTAKNADIKTGQGMEQAAQQQATQSLANRPMAQRDILGRNVPETTSAARGESGVGAGPALEGWTVGAGGVGATVPRLVRMGIGGVTGYTGSEIGERAGGRIGRMADEALAGFRGMPAETGGQWERIGRIGGGLTGGLIGGGLGYKYGLPESIEQKYIPFRFQSPQTQGRTIELAGQQMEKEFESRGVKAEREAAKAAKAEAKAAKAEQFKPPQRMQFPSAAGGYDPYAESRGGTIDVPPMKPTPPLPVPSEEPVFKPPPRMKFPSATGGYDPYSESRGGTAGIPRIGAAKPTGGPQTLEGVGGRTGSAGDLASWREEDLWNGYVANKGTPLGHALGREIQRRGLATSPRMTVRP